MRSSAPFAIGGNEREADSRRPVHMSSLSVLILSFNEAIHIERAIASVSAIAAEVVVVDSGSTDATVELARGAGARVLHHPFVNQAKSFQWGLDHAGLRGDWVMRLDADEVIESPLAEEIAERLETLPRSISGVVLKRRHIFMGKVILHGGRFPLKLLRIWRRGCGRVEDRWMDEHVVLSSGDTVTFQHPFSDANLNDLTFFTDKHNRYATREAIEVLNKKYGLFRRDPGLIGHSGSRQAVLKRVIKERIYNRIPFGLSVSAYLFYRYFIQLGFLDGQEGFIYHVLQGGWYRFLVGAKVSEWDRSLAAVSTQAGRLAALSRLSGYRLGGDGV